MSGIAHQVGATCPSCGRFVGPLERCPFCGAHIKKRLPLRVLRLACLVLAILGIAILVYAVSGTPTPTIKIGAVGATMNFAYVRLEGLVTRGPFYDTEAQSLRFYIADETGELQASTFREVTEQLRAQNKIPATGDKIMVEGTLRIRDDFASFNVAAADRLTLVPPSPRRIKMSEIGADDEFDYVVVQGTVREIREPYSGLTLVALEDASAELDIAVYGDVEKLHGAPPVVGPGDTVEAQGVVTFYRDMPQLVLRHPSGIFILRSSPQVSTTTIASSTSPRATRTPRPTHTPTRAPIARTIGSISPSDQDVSVVVSGTIARAESFSRGMRYTLEDGTGRIILLIWSDVLEKLEIRDRLVAGAEVRAAGKVDLFNDMLEVIPARAEDVHLVAAAVVPTEAIRAISSLSTADLDATVLIYGTITETADFSAGKYTTLRDESGTIRVTVFDDELEPIRDQLAVGAEVSVRGRVNVFRGNLEVVAQDFMFP